MIKIYFLFVFLCIDKIFGEDGIEEQFYNLILNHKSRNMSYSLSSSITKMHLIRIPKASSSSLSAIARRMVNCDPPGPCCRYPGDPPGSCPAPKSSPNLLMCTKKIIGCVHHFPNVEYLNKPLSERLITISMMREPISRSLSAFAYHPPHTLSKKNHLECKDTPFSNDCFTKYVSNKLYNNIAVKMLAGAFPYANQEVCANNCKYSYEKAKINLDKLTLMGITELWALSILILYAKIPQIEPKLEEFYAYSSGGGDKGVYSRKNRGEDYMEFKKTVKSNFPGELDHQNHYDVLLYADSIRLLCDHLHDEGFWKYDIVKQNWNQSVPIQYNDAAPRCYS